MSNVSEALEALRRKGLRVSQDRPHSAEREASGDHAEEEFREEQPDISYGYEEYPVCSVKVMKMNFDNIKLELIELERNEQNLEQAIHMMVEAMFMLRTELEELRSERYTKMDIPF